DLSRADPGQRARWPLGRRACARLVGDAGRRRCGAGDPRRRAGGGDRRFWIRQGGARPGAGDRRRDLLDGYKRRGLGGALFRSLVDWLSARGCTSAGLWVLDTNVVARRFYAALGGRLGPTKVDQRADVTLNEVAYMWDSIGRWPVDPSD